MKNIYVLFFVFIVILLHSQESVQKKGRNYLVIIALDDYKNRLPINGHVQDAIDIKWNIYSKYDIDEITELYNMDASNENINKLFKELLAKVKTDDSLIFYFSGHGFIDDNLKEGYWLPYDSGINETEKENWISNSYVIDKFNQIKANQIFLIIDSCFIQSKVDIINPENKIKITDDYLINKNNKRVRQIINSGVNETSSEKSDFSEVLVSFFKRSDKKNIDPVIIFQDIKNKLKKSTPYYGQLSNTKYNKDGTFVFIPRLENLSINDLIKEDSREKTPEEIAELESKKVIKLDITKTEKNLTVITNKNNKRIPQISYTASANDLSVLNKVGLALLPTFSTITLAGASILIVDLIPILKALDNEMNNGVSYETYVNLYNTHIALFITGVVLTSVGVLGVIGSIPILVYKDKNKKITFNITPDPNNLTFDFRCSF